MLKNEDYEIIRDCVEIEMQRIKKEYGSCKKLNQLKRVKFKVIIEQLKGKGETQNRPLKTFSELLGRLRGKMGHDNYTR